MVKVFVLGFVIYFVNLIKIKLLFWVKKFFWVIFKYIDRYFGEVFIENEFVKFMFV